MRKKLACIVLACICIMSTLISALPLKIEATSSSSETNSNKKVRPDLTIPVDIIDYTSESYHTSLVEELGGEAGPFLRTEEDGFVSWQVNVPQEGYYNLHMRYYTVEGKGSSIVRSLYINDEIQVQGLTFSRAFVNEAPPETDSRGNQVRSVQVETPMWLETYFKDVNGYTREPLLFYFKKGINTIKIESVREPIVIGSLKLCQVYTACTYDDYKANYSKTNKLPKDTKPIEIQGEDAILKSDSMIYQLSDKSSSATQPNNPELTLLNTIGAEKWSSVGQWICWEFEVKEEGLYKLSLRYRQNQTAGQSSYRSIEIIDEQGNGPRFAELDSVQFTYDSDWKINTLGNGKEDFKFFLEPGKYTLRMEVVLGDMADMACRVEERVKSLNSIYRKFLMVIGPSPDPNRDYQFSTLLPEELKQLREESKILEEIYDDFVAINGMGGSQAQTLRNIATQAKMMSVNPHKIASVFGDFSTNISGLGSWLTTIKTQALEVDYILFTIDDNQIPKVKDGFFKRIAFGIRQFLASFTSSYNVQFEDKTTRSVEVWLPTGRDQANALTQMARNYFTPTYNIQAQITLVPAGTLLTATLAGRGPDVALSLGQSDPMNYAIRGAVEDISGYPGFSEVKNRFQESSMIPLTFNNAVYGLPETQNFPVMFYRTDILEELGLSVPQTWDDVIAMLPVLNKNSLNFGLPQPMSTTAVGIGFSAYTMFLYQNGGKLYNDNATVPLLDSDEAITAFTKWCNFYTQYSMPHTYDFINRFRSGEIPIGISDYGTYNSLSMFAPELSGMWEFALVPGTKNENGDINRSVVSTITACSMMSDADDKEAAWEFMKWWTSAQTQEQFGREIESIMGTAGRYQTANIEALYKIPWNTKDFNILMKQWNYTCGIPEIPGSYMTPRYLDFGVKQVVLNNTIETDPAQVLINQNKRIAEEIKIKRKEFSLD